MAISTKKVIWRNLHIYKNLLEKHFHYLLQFLSETIMQFWKSLMTKEREKYDMIEWTEFHKKYDIINNCDQIHFLCKQTSLSAHNSVSLLWDGFTFWWEFRTVQKTLKSVKTLDKNLQNQLLHPNFDLQMYQIKKEKIMLHWEKNLTWKWNFRNVCEGSPAEVV